jgi:hypothetical protein
MTTNADGTEYEAWPSVDKNSPAAPVNLGKLMAELDAIDREIEWEEKWLPWIWAGVVLFPPSIWLAVWLCIFFA